MILKNINLKIFIASIFASTLGFALYYLLQNKKINMPNKLPHSTNFDFKEVAINNSTTQPSTGNSTEFKPLTTHEKSTPHLPSARKLPAVASFVTAESIGMPIGLSKIPVMNILQRKIEIQKLALNGNGEEARKLGLISQSFWKDYPRKIDEKKSNEPQKSRIPNDDISWFELGAKAGDAVSAQLYAIAVLGLDQTHRLELMKTNPDELMRIDALALMFLKKTAEQGLTDPYYTMHLAHIIGGFGMPLNIPKSHACAILFHQTSNTKISEKILNESGNNMTAGDLVIANSISQNWENCFDR